MHHRSAGQVWSRAQLGCGAAGGGAVGEAPSLNPKLVPDLTLRMMASASFLQAARSRVRVLTMMESVSP
jgi:hypothetical protein